jgi:hypothetical protein
MNDPDLFFVVPTYRLREVSETIKQYDDHFRQKHAGMTDSDGPNNRPYVASCGESNLSASPI